MRFLTVLFALLAALTLSSCDGYFEKTPVGIGSDAHELRKSPCACLRHELAPGLPQWLG